MSLDKSRLTITDWKKSDRPREKFLAKGFNSLSDAELIAILFGSGSRAESAVDLAKRLLQQYDNSLNLLAELPVKKITEIYGIGNAKAISLLVAFELGKRRRSEKVDKTNKIECPYDLLEFMQDKNADIKHEEFWVIYLSQSNYILTTEMIGKGGISNTSVDIRLIMKTAIEYNATGIMLCHNHPSGDVTASESDIILTRSILDAAKIFSIRVMDHIIIAKDKYYSFFQEGILG